MVYKKFTNSLCAEYLEPASPSTTYFLSLSLQPQYRLSCCGHIQSFRDVTEETALEWTVPTGSFCC
jgi:hypothetical protein